MKKTAKFQVSVSDKDRIEFANLKAAKIATMGRSPTGKIPSMEEAGADLKWVLDNIGSLISGAIIELSAGNIP